MELLNGLRYSFHLIFHPFDGFWDLKHEKRGNMKSAMVIVALVILTYIMQRQLTGFLFNYNDLKSLNIFTEIISVVLPFFLWCVANWCLTTLMDGEGSFRDIVITTAYALVPIIIINIPLILVSHALTLEEGAFYYFFNSFSWTWSVILIILGTMVVHQYSLAKTLFTCVLIVVGMGLIVFIGLLFFSLLQQMFGFVYIIYREIAFRL